MGEKSTPRNLGKLLRVVFHTTPRDSELLRVVFHTIPRDSSSTPPSLLWWGHRLSFIQPKTEKTFVLLMGRFVRLSVPYWFSLHQDFVLFAAAFMPHSIHGPMAPTDDQELLGGYDFSGHVSESVQYALRDPQDQCQAHEAGG